MTMSYHKNDSVLHRPFASTPRTFTVGKAPKVISSLGQSKNMGARPMAHGHQQIPWGKRNLLYFILYKSLISDGTQKGNSKILLLHDMLVTPAQHCSQSNL